MPSAHSLLFQTPNDQMLMVDRLKGYKAGSVSITDCHNKMIIISVLLCFAICYSAALGKECPVVSPNFSVDTVEVAGDINSTDVVVQQTITQDIDLRRSNMIARGTLVHGALQQIRRCDTRPIGWYVQLSGAQPDKPALWDCTNSTIPRVDERPAMCQYSSFWAMPPMKYEGIEQVNGQSCDKWSFILDDSGSIYAFWALEDTAIPAATGRISNPTNPTALYTIFFSNFQDGPLPDSLFMPSSDVQCPEATRLHSLNEPDVFYKNIVHMILTATNRLNALN